MHKKELKSQQQCVMPREEYLATICASHQLQCVQCLGFTSCSTDLLPASKDMCEKFYPAT